MNKSRIITLVAATTTALALSIGGATASGLIGSADIKDNSIKSVDLKDGKAVRGKDLAPGLKTLINQPGPQGEQGPPGPAGDSHNVYVQTFGSMVEPVAGDQSGLSMTGEGAQFGPFADGGACSTPGQDYARLVFHGLDGEQLSAVNQLDYTGLTTSNDNTSGVGSLTMRITTDHAGNADYPHNKFVFSPNTQAGPDANADTRGQVKTYYTTLGSWRLNDDAGERPADEAPWSHWVAANGTEHITKIDILLGCEAGHNLQGVVHSISANGTNYVLGKIG